MDNKGVNTPVGGCYFRTVSTDAGKSHIHFNASIGHQTIVVFGDANGRPVLIIISPSNIDVLSGDSYASATKTDSEYIVNVVQYSKISFISNGLIINVYVD